MKPLDSVALAGAALPQQEMWAPAHHLHWSPSLLLAGTGSGVFRPFLCELRDCKTQGATWGTRSSTSKPQTDLLLLLLSRKLLTNCFSLSPRVSKVYTKVLCQKLSHFSCSCQALIFMLAPSRTSMLLLLIPRTFLLLPAQSVSPCLFCSFLSTYVV